MNFEKPVDPSLEGRLSEEEAHDEANAISYKADVSPKTGRVVSVEQGSRIEREATPEDYEAALGALEDIKELAQKDPTVFEKMFKYGTRSVVAITLPIGILGSIYNETLNGVLWGKGDVAGAVKKDINSAKEYFKDDFPFTEAQRRLESLKAEAQRFAEGQTKRKEI
jgi:hypothetical protein